MIHDKADLWFIAYDIRDPGRLRRVHRYLKKSALSLQYSAFCLEGSEQDALRVLDQLNRIIDAAKDDIRAYRLPHALKVWKLGRQGLPSCLTMTSTAALTALLQCTSTQGEPDKVHHEAIGLLTDLTILSGPDG